ncbi:MAG: hypothetical protein ACMUIA_12490 [bacterium]
MKEKEEVIYKHRQTGYVVLLSLGLSIPIITGLMVSQRTGPAVPLCILLATLVGLAILFWSLTVEVRPGTLRLKFGPGLIRKTIPMSKIQGCRTVRNPWYYGWGIHLTPRGWLYNVSGFEAVELDLAGGRHVRIGTDEPEKLGQAIMAVMEGHGL